MLEQVLHVILWQVRAEIILSTVTILVGVGRIHAPPTMLSSYPMTPAVVWLLYSSGWNDRRVLLDRILSVSQSSMSQGNCDVVYEIVSTGMCTNCTPGP